MTIRHLSATPAGLLYALAVEDPHNLLRAVRIERNGQVRDVALPPAARPVRDLSGFVGFARLSGRRRPRSASADLRIGAGADDPRGQVVGLSRRLAGGLRRSRAGRRRGPRRGAPVDRTAGEHHRLPGSRRAPGATDAQPDRARRRGPRPDPGACGDDLRRAGLGDVEVVCHVPAGRLADAARIAIADAVAVYGIGHRLVIVPPGADRGEGLLAALSHARGSAMLLLGAGVLPAGPGWLTPWRCRLVAARPVLGGTLLDTSGAVIDAGGKRPRRPGATWGCRRPTSPAFRRWPPRGSVPSASA